MVTHALQNILLLLKNIYYIRAFILMYLYMYKPIYVYIFIISRDDAIKAIK